jgi:multiple sugar transport system permease protein
MRQVLALLLLIMLAILFTGPFLYAFFGSFKGPIEVMQYPPTLFPTIWHPLNYVEVFQQAPFGRWLFNTVELVVLNVAGSVMSASLVGYAFSRFRWPGRDIVFLLAMGTLMLPREVTTIPTYVLFSRIGWLDTLNPLFIPAWFGGGAFLIFLFRQYFMTLPRELDEAAYIDGAGPFRIYWSLILPLSKPIIATAVVLTFVSVWSDFWGPFIFLSTRENFTVSLGLRLFSTEVVRTTGVGKATQHLLLAATMISVVPCLLVFTFTQRYFVRSIVMTGLKG